MSSTLLPRLWGMAAVVALAVSACATPTFGPPPSGLEQDGYVLSCDGVPERDCRRRAVEEASSWLYDGSTFRAIRWITVKPDGEAETCLEARWGLTYCYWSQTISG